MQNFTIDMGYRQFEQSEELKRTLAYGLVSGLVRNADEKILIDPTLNETLTGLEILSAAREFSKTIKTLTKNPRVGIILPPAKQSFIANIACIFAGKVPVNLNFTMGKTAAAQCLEASQIDAEITTAFWSTKISAANPDFPWAKNVFDMDFLKESKPAEDFRGKTADEIAKIIGIEKFSPDKNREATLVFTSGSEGAPKAAALTERNIIANCLQCHLSRIFEDGDILFGNLPVFHSFGLLFEIWMAALHGVKILLYPSPIDVKGNIRAIREFKPTIMVGTPTFYRAYIRHANKEDLASLRTVIAGAEKTPEGFQELWNSSFPNALYREGYGLTETSPVAGVNLPERDFGYFSTGAREGSIGKLFPGMQAQIISLESGEVLPFGSRGLLKMRGANVFPGYLNNPEATKKTLSPDGWITTGDIARLDADGFVFIEGRHSRFSKIGGEMIPHATVETALAKALKLDSGDLPQIAVSARVNEGKGESLVLISTVPVELAHVKEALKSEGISNLWIPKHIVRVDKIPILASGKLDLKKLAELAKE